MMIWYPKSFRRLRTKVMVFGLLMSIVPFLILGMMNLHIAKEKLIEEVDSANQAFLANGVNQLETLLSHSFETLYVLRDALASENLEEGDYYFLFSSFMKNIPYVENVTSFGPGGTELYKVDRWSISNDLEREQIRNITMLEQIQAGKVFIGPVLTNEEQKIIVDLAIPASHQNRKEGGIRVKINLKQMFDQLVAQAHLNKASYLYVLDQNAKLIAEPFPIAGSSDHMAPAETQHLKERYGKIPISAGQIAHQLYRNSQGDLVTGYAMRVPRTNWIIILEQPEKVAFASYYQLELNLILSTFLIGFLVAFISVVFALFFSKPIEKIEAGVKRIARGDLTSRIRVQTKDEIGRLAETFNDMAKSLEGKTSEIMEEKKRLDLVVSGMGMGLILIDENYLIRWINRTVIDWFGELGDLIGKDCRHAFSDKCNLCKQCPVRTRTMVEEKQKEMISRRMDAEGKWRYFRHQIFMLNPERDQSSFLEVIEDITEKREMEAAVMQADKLSAIGLLASGIAHEINNPLGILSVYSEDLKDRLEEEDVEDLLKSGEIQGYLDTMQKQIIRCKTITSNLLNFSRKSMDTLEKIDIHQGMDEIMMLLEHELKRKRVHINKHYGSLHPYVFAINGEIQQVLLNIISNALDAIESEGSIEIHTLDAIQDSVVIEIKDNGKGIPPENLPHIFDPFFTTKPIGKGTGLGLSVCYGILRRLGGEIQIQSQTGKGSHVMIRIPIAKGEKNAS